MHDVNWFILAMPFVAVIGSWRFYNYLSRKAR